MYDLFRHLSDNELIRRDANRILYPSSAAVFQLLPGRHTNRKSCICVANFMEKFLYEVTRLSFFPARSQKFRTAAISLNMSVRPSARNNSSLTGRNFHKIWLSVDCPEIGRENLNFMKIG